LYNNLTKKEICDKIFSKRLTLFFLDDNSIFPIEEVKVLEILINYINKVKEKTLIKKSDDDV